MEKNGQPEKGCSSESLRPTPQKPILKKSRNYWRRANSSRLSYVIDAAPFYKAFYEAALQAERQLFIVGWDTDSRVELLVGQDRPVDKPVRLKEFLLSLCEAKPELRVYILSWDFNLIYALEREVLPQVKFDWMRRERIRFILDDTHAPLGSHHQKVVVIDDRIAFSGGLDICARRWDTHEHLAQDERRTDPWGKTYGPFHDVQVALAGDAAVALGDLVRERWERATGESVPPPSQSRVALRREIWPPSLPVDLNDVDIAISRTLPGSRNERPVHEVEHLFIDSIRAAKKSIYFEAQYFSSPLIAECMARRLREPDGPEIVMVIPRDATGWIEESTMTVLRARMLDIVTQADLFQRFKIYIPIVPNLTKGYVKVHSKVTIIDDCFCRIGSANLNQRSMGLDTECDISFEANGDERIRSSIAHLRARLLSEHLGIDVREFETCFAKNGSLIAAIQELRGGSRTLVEFQRRIPEWLDILVPHNEVLDPRGPYRLRFLPRYFPDLRAAVSHHVPWLGRFKILSLLAILSILVLAWNFTPLGFWFELERIASALHEMRVNPISPAVVIIAFIVGGVITIPLIALIVATALMFDPLGAFLLALAGTIASAAATYALGYRFRDEQIVWLANGKLRQVKDKLRRGGWLAIAVVRMVPIAPFAVINLIAGAARIPFNDFILGTAAGTLPAIAVLTLMASQLVAFSYAPDLRGMFLLAVLILALIATYKLVKSVMLSRAS